MKPTPHVGYQLHAGTLAYEILSDSNRVVVDYVAENVKGKPWVAVFAAVKDAEAKFQHNLDSILDSTGGSLNPTERQAAAEDHARNFAIFIAALLERIGANSFKVDDPFQATLYINSARPEFWEAAKPYILSIGGMDKLSDAMKAWVIKHPEEKDQIPETVWERLKIEKGG